MTARILTGDCRAILPTLDAGSVHCVVTSPPYFGLRDYGTAQWDGGAAECDHISGLDKPRSSRPLGQFHGGDDQFHTTPFRDTCGKCGAVRQDQQIGLESSLDAYIAELVTVFRLVHRVLRDDGTVWLNLGSSYGPNKCDLMVPARVALALIDDAWILRSDIIWAKKAPMPESVTDRPTSAHEHVFLLTKKPRYYFDATAVQEKSESDHGSGNGYKRDARLSFNGRGNDEPYTVQPTRNLRNVWHLGPQSFAQAHFATFPTTLVEPCIKAGTSEKGCCAACGAPWTRQVSQRPYPAELANAKKAHGGIGNNLGGQRHQDWMAEHPRSTLGWQAGCHCNADVVPCTVLDPFMGAGTVALVADRLGRDSVGIELSAEYADMARQRITGDAPMFAEVSVT